MDQETHKSRKGESMSILRNRGWNKDFAVAILNIIQDKGEYFWNNWKDRRSQKKRQKNIERNKMELLLI